MPAKYSNHTLSINLVNYEFPGVTANCGGGGAVTETLHDRLQARDHDSQVVTDRDGGHYVTSPLRLFPQLQRARDSDVINAHFSVPSGLPAAHYAREHGTPLVVSVMGADIYDPSRFGLLKHPRDLANQYVFASADRVVAPSTDMARRVREQYGIDPKVIHYGIDPDRYRWQPRKLQSPVQLLSVCRLVQRKNLDRAIAAASELRERGHNVNYRIVGKGPERARLRREHRGTDWLSFPGYAENLSQFYAAADVFFLPSLHEAFGMVYLEALAAGLPVVGSNSGGATDILTHEVGGCPDPHDTADIRRALSAVLNDYASYQKATRGYVRRRFSASQMTDAYENLYREVRRHGERTAPALRAD